MSKVNYKAAFVAACIGILALTIMSELVALWYGDIYIKDGANNRGGKLALKISFSQWRENYIEAARL